MLKEMIFQIKGNLTNLTMSTSSQPLSRGVERKDLEKMKEDVSNLNKSMEESRMDLTRFIMQTNMQSQVAKNLEKEALCKAKLEALKKLFRDETET